jgi:hypothetical protein
MATTCYPVSGPDVPRISASRPRLATSISSQVAKRASAIDHLVLVTIDGVRWQEVFRGVDTSLASRTKARHQLEMSPEALLPNIHRIATTHGVLLGKEDSQVRVSSPSTVSLPGYSELFSGKTPRCANNDCPQTTETTLLDDWHRADPEATMAVFSSWARIPRAVARDVRHLVVSAGRNDVRVPARLSSDKMFRRMLADGTTAGPAPGTDDYRPDRHTAEAGLRALEVLRPAFLFLALGDTDEQAHHGDYEAYLSALRQADEVLGHLDAWLCSQQQLGKRTLLIVATDHGRAASFQNHGGSPEAARIWTLWSGDDVRLRGYPAVPASRLADVASTIRRLLDLPTNASPDAGRNLAVLFDEPTKRVDSERDWRLLASQRTHTATRPVEF